MDYSDIFYFINIITPVLSKPISILKYLFNQIAGFIFTSFDFLYKSFAFILSILPIIINIIYFSITHFYIFLIIIECLILCEVIITSGFINKLKIFAERHIQIFKIMLNIPKYFVNIIRGLSQILSTIVQIMFTIIYSIDQIITWIIMLIDKLVGILAGIAKMFA